MPVARRLATTTTEANPEARGARIARGEFGPISVSRLCPIDATLLELLRERLTRYHNLDAAIAYAGALHPLAQVVDARNVDGAQWSIAVFPSELGTHLFELGVVAFANPGAPGWSMRTVNEADIAALKLRLDYEV